MRTRIRPWFHEAQSRCAAGHVYRRNAYAAWWGLTSADVGSRLGSRRPTARRTDGPHQFLHQEESSKRDGRCFPAPLPLPRLLASALEPTVTHSHAQLYRTQRPSCKRSPNSADRPTFRERNAFRHVFGTRQRRTVFRASGAWIPVADHSARKPLLVRPSGQDTGQRFVSQGGSNRSPIPRPLVRNRG